MPIALLVIGAIFLVAAVRGEHEKLFGLLKDDFTGPNNFILWAVGIWAVGAIGYYKPLKPLSVAFMTLIIIVIFLAQKGFFEKFMDQIGSTTYSGGGARRDYGLSTGKYNQTSDDKKLFDKITNGPIGRNVLGAIGKII